jgi:C4-dicarboxylate transporter DctQ subunit
MTGTQSRFSQAVESVEETFIAITLGLMTIITFANVVARYVFNSNILWALEVTVVLFAWLVLVGASYGVKRTFHIGVDVVINLMPPAGKKIAAILAVAASLTFALLLLKGAWDYWLPFATERIWMETDDIPMPDFLAWIGPLINEGEAYEKVPRFVTYFALPLGMALLVLRLLEVAWKVVTNQQASIIASHEVEDLIEEAAAHIAGSQVHGHDQAPAGTASADRNKNEER